MNEIQSKRYRTYPSGRFFDESLRVLVVATVAGTAPALSYVVRSGHTLYLSWIGNNHQETLGEEILYLVRSVQQSHLDTKFVIRATPLFFLARNLD